MNWEELFQMQQVLDLHIEEKHNLTEVDLFEDKYLALLVELGELANETRCFKFWSNKPRNDQAIILEEYVDGIHFILSLGLEKDYRFQGKTEIIDNNDSIEETEQFNRVFASCQEFKQHPTEKNYEQLFTTYLILGEVLGFQEKDIFHAYKRKNEINHERQNKGY